MPKGVITTQQRNAVLHYIENGSKSKAYEAFYSTNFKKRSTLHSKANAMFKVPKVKAFLDKMLDEQKERHHVTVDRIIQEYEKLAFSDVRKIFGDDGQVLDVRDLPDDIAGAVSSVKFNVTKNDDGDDVCVVEYKISDKRAALQDLGKHFKMFSEDINLKAEVTTEDVSDLELARRLAFILAKGANAAT